MISLHSDSLQMSVLSRQVTSVSQELQEVTRLLKPLFHNTSTLLMPSAVTPPPCMSSHSCSPAPALLTQHAPVHCPDCQNPPPILVPEPSSPPQSMAKVLLEKFDPLQCSPSQTITSQNPYQTRTAPLASHCSAPPSLNSSPHEHAVAQHPYPCCSIPSLSSSSHLSSIPPLLVDLSGPGSEPQTHPQYHHPLLSQSESQLQLQPESQSMSWSYPHSLSQPQLQTPLQPSSMASHPENP